MFKRTPVLPPTACMTNATSSAHPRAHGHCILACSFRAVDWQAGRQGTATPEPLNWACLNTPAPTTGPPPHPSGLGGALPTGRRHPNPDDAGTTGPTIAPPSLATRGPNWCSPSQTTWTRKLESHKSQPRLDSDISPPHPGDGSTPTTPGAARPQSRRRGDHRTTTAPPSLATWGPNWCNTFRAIGIAHLNLHRQAGMPCIWWFTWPCWAACTVFQHVRAHAINTGMLLHVNYGG